MKYKELITDYFTFNRKEQRGLFVLITIVLLLLIANRVAPYVISQKPVDFSGFAKEIEAYEKELALYDSLDTKQKNKKYRGTIYGSTLNNSDTMKENMKSVKEIFFIELNSADTFDLQRLRGIGSSFAKRIVNYRIRLGGYLDKSQVLEVFGMDSIRYNGIKDHLTVNQDSIHRIDLNAVTFKELLYHPYFPFEVTKAIMLYRKDHKKFQNPEELKKIPIINDSIYRKIHPYVRVASLIGSSQ